MIREQELQNTQKFSLSFFFSLNLTSIGSVIKSVFYDIRSTHKKENSRGPQEFGLARATCDRGANCDDVAVLEAGVPAIEEVDITPIDED